MNATNLIDSLIQLNIELTKLTDELNKEMNQQKEPVLVKKRLSKFRRVKSIKQLRIGDRVCTTNQFPMIVCGIYKNVYNDTDSGEVYLDFQENDADIWEEKPEDLQFCGNFFSVLWKKLTR